MKEHGETKNVVLRGQDSRKAGSHMVFFIDLPTEVSHKTMCDLALS